MYVYQDVSKTRCPHALQHKPDKHLAALSPEIRGRGFHIPAAGRGENDVDGLSNAELVNYVGLRSWVPVGRAGKSTELGFLFDTYKRDGGLGPSR